MKSIIEKVGEVKLTKNSNYFESLVEQMIHQQITGKAAATIFQRFKTLFPDELITPEELLKLTEDELLSAGISRQKRGYLYSLSEKFIDGTIKPEKFEQMTDEDIIADLIKAKGIGPWTAQMFLIMPLTIYGEA
ncbi:MAG: DNA-3-methyladenine glycosylase 2 family protein [Asgard group archaeon]|nr:DNA-3-methyladenine glycosylase 2 family protein [Asgard group archaeon]